MRGIYPIIFSVLIVALLVCAIIAARSSKANGKRVSLLLSALIPPMVGNLIIILSESPILSYIGCLLYFIGMNFVMFSLLLFTFDYCEISEKRRKFKWIAYALLIADTISLLLNFYFGHAFYLEQITVSGQLYYRFVPLFGQTIHRVIDYGIFLVILVIFLVKIITCARVYLEKYAVIFGAMIVFGIWQSFYIFSRTPIDRSMIGFGVFGLLVFFFSILYRPMRLLDRMLISMASELQEALLFFDRNRECIWANDKGLSFLGLKQGELGKTYSVLTDLFGVPPKTYDDWNEQKVVLVDNKPHYYYIQKKTVYDSKNRITGVFLNIRDNTEERIELEAERFNATHDSVTGLYNREYLYEQIRKELEEHPKKRYQLYVASVDGFEVIVDVYGTRFGENALRQIATWIDIDIPKGSIYGRLNDTEFGALIPEELADTEYLEHMLSHSVVRADSVEQHVFIHFGVYKVKPADRDISVMFDRARLAMNNVKSSLTEYVGYYDSELRDTVLWNHQISADLPTALKEGQIEPYLQPIMNSAGELVGAEVLARWNHPEEGFLKPDAFIPVFEKNGLIAEIDRFMWRSACELLARWKEEGKDLFLSVNISPKDFDVMDVVAEIKGLVHEYGVEPSKLRLEITESALGINQKSRIQILSELREDGFFIEMDDFGSGYSSMNLLKDMPLDLVKLDMVFLQKSENIERAKMIVQMIINLAHQLKFYSLMEGVETERQYRILSEMGCEYFQGYYFSKPVAVPRFLEMLDYEKKLNHPWNGQLFL